MSYRRSKFDSGSVRVKQLLRPLTLPVSISAFKLSHILCSTASLPLSHSLCRNHLIFLQPLNYTPFLLFPIDLLYLASMLITSSLLSLTSHPSSFSTDVHQGETDQPCDEGGAYWLQEQGDGGGRWHGGHGIGRQRTAQGETKPREGCVS